MTNRPQFVAAARPGRVARTLLTRVAVPLAALSAGCYKLTDNSTPPVPDHLVFVAQPFLAGSTHPITPPVQVAIADASGTIILTETDPVTVAIGTNPGGGTLTGTTTQAAAGGVSKFADLSINQPATGYTLVATSGTLPAATSASFEVFPLFTTASSVTTGYATTCGLTPAGRAYCWGHNSVGELGDGTTGAVAYPVPVSGGLAFNALSGGGTHECGVAVPANSAYCWGHNDQGQLGVGMTSVSDSVPAAVAGGLTFTSVSAGGLHTCGVLTSSGAAYCWGYNFYGALGNATNTDSPSPVAVAGGITFAAVSAGQNHTCGITAAHVAYCWGANNMGQLGDGTMNAHSVPVAVSGGLTFSSITAGGAHTCAIASGGAAYCWGLNAQGELGTGNTTQSSVPIAVSGGLSFIDVSVSLQHSCGVTSGNVTYCWGANPEGELGNGTTGGVSLAPAPVVP